MSAPRTKRQFAGDASQASQRQITSYFSKQASSNPSAQKTSTYSPANASLSPALPSAVQSNLLSVGMRVRKSVPEGYKTGSAYSAFKLFTDASCVPTRAATSSPSTGTPQRELLPFCGINKVGGLEFPAEQDMAALPQEIFNGEDVPAEDEVPGLSLSQESVTSTTSAVLASVKPKKRFFAEEGEDKNENPVQVWRDRDAWLADNGVSPRTTEPVSWSSGRVFAVPRPKKNSTAAVVGTQGKGDQENAMVADEDFEEATFIDFAAMEE